MSDKDCLPLLDHSYSDQPVFLPSNMLESARVQKNLPPLIVPEGCLLDFDGELVDFLVANGKAKLEPAWPCFHTRLYLWHANGTEYGIIGGTIGASFAVLVAEELFALGCKALVTISSAGLIAENLQPPMFLLIDKALRDEGTSYHYLPRNDSRWRRLLMWQLLPGGYTKAPCNSVRGVPGLPTLRSVKHQSSSRQGEKRGSLQLKWRRLPCWQWRKLLKNVSYALPISRTPWPHDLMTLKKGATMATRQP